MVVAALFAAWQKTVGIILREEGEKMTDEKKLFAEWYSLGAQELAQGTVETRAMLVPGAGVLVQIEARTAGGRAALTAQWMPGVVIYEGRLVGGEWADRMMQVKMGARANALPVPVAAPEPVVTDAPPADARTVIESELTSVLTSAKKVMATDAVDDTPLAKLARKTRARKSKPPA